MIPFDPLQTLETGTNLIEASAGTGKTWTIEALVLRFVVEKHLPIDKILVVTFTDAATAELQERVRSRLWQALQHFSGKPVGDDEFLRRLHDGLAGPDALERARKDLSRALCDFDKAAISTIHGFCNRALHTNAFESGVLFDIELHGDLSPLLEELVADFWTASLHDADPVFVHFLKRKGTTPLPPPTQGWRPPGVYLSELARKLCSAPDLYLLDRLDSPPPPLETEQLEGLYQQLRDLWQPHAQELLTALKRLGTHEIAHKRYILERLFRKVDDWLDHDRFTPPPAQFESLTREALGRGVQRPRLPQASHLASLLDAIDSFYERWSQDMEPLLEQHLLHLQTRLATTIREVFDRSKRKARSWSYDDLLTQLDRALAGPQGEALAEAMRKETRAVLVDEFQDTDPVQYRIFSRVYGGRDDTWLYLIGDPKQAIYGFRGADIFAYMRAVRDAGDQRFTLDTNRRSDAPLVDALNATYARLTRPFVFDEIAHAPVKHVEPTRLVDDLQPLLVRWVSTRDRRQRNRRNRLRYEFLTDTLPQVVAADVARLLKLGSRIEVEAEGERELRPGDIAILVRSNKAGLPIQAALRQLGIDSVLHAASNVLATDEARELEQLMAAVAEPARRQAVCTALTTELLGQSANDLVALEDQDGESWDRWVERLRTWRSLWEEQSFARMFRALFETGDTLSRVLGMPDGERRMTNLLHLNELLSTAAAEQDLGINGLLRWFRLHRTKVSESKDMELRLESDSAAVQITTVHKAKGLEWPVVLCTGLFTGHKLGQPPLLFHDRDHADRHSLALDPSAPEWGRHLVMARHEQRAEDARLLYVALTRARHRVVLYSCPMGSYERSPIAQLLHQTPAVTPDQVLDQTIERVGKLGDRAIYQELSSYVETLSGVQLWEPVDRPMPWVSHDAAPDSPLAARTRARSSLDPSWRIGSFSSLSRRDGPRAGPVAEGRDHDHDHDQPDLVPDESPDIVLSAFPRGAKAGTFVHDVLEHLDFQFQEPDELQELVKQRLKLHGYDPGTWAETVVEALQQVLNTPLDDSGWTLRQLPDTDRINELQFTLPVGMGLKATDSDLATRLVPKHLAQVFQEHASPHIPSTYTDDLETLDFEPLHGFLTGFIDLIYRRGERWWVVDYKSNHLGDQLADYGCARLPDAMAHGHYFLQYHLYCVALHRTLKRRLPDYDYASHFGGAQYLFIKGMTPDSGADFGVYTDRPSLDMIEALDSLLADSP